MEQQSPMGKKFDELVKGSGVWGEIAAAVDYKPYDSFDVELNVPKGLAGIDFVLPEMVLGVDFSNIQMAVAYYKTPYPGMDPKRHWSILATPVTNLQPHYPITSVDSISLRRCEEERYFTNFEAFGECYLEAEERGVPMHEIAHEFDGKTAQEMIDHFRLLDAQIHRSA